MKDRAYEIAINAKYDGNQIGLASCCTNFLIIKQDEERKQMQWLQKRKCINYIRKTQKAIDWFFWVIKKLKKKEILCEV